MVSDNPEETELREKSKAFMAGVMDAEGCIRLAMQSRKDSAYFSPRVYMSNQSLDLMKWSVHHFGGNFVRNKNSGAGESWYLWYLQSLKSTQTFLTCILPYLSYKKEQAQTLIDFCQQHADLPEAKKFEVFNNLKQLKVLGSVTTETHSNYIKADNAYLAGFFDGEGCIRINKTPTKNTISYHLVISVTNTWHPILVLYKSLYGGLIRLKQERCYDWILSDKMEAEKFLLCSLPYLVAKRSEAQAALEYVRLGRKICPEKRDELYTRLMHLKKLKIQSELHGDMQSGDNGSCHSLNTL